MNSPTLQRNTFLAMLIVVSLAFGLVLLPFAGAVFWSAVLAILFWPAHRRLLQRLNGRRNLAALLTLTLCLLLVILPMVVVTLSLIKEGATVYEQVRTGQIDFAAYFRQMVSALPAWATQLLARLDLLELQTIQTKLGQGVMQGSQQIASRVLGIGQNTLDFFLSFGIMLYVLFFLLRDGAALARRIRDAVPLSAMHKQYLSRRFTTVIRATVKGNVVVAAVQGALGGVMFYMLGIQGALLWGVVMALLSLLPAIGAAVIWFPVAVYFLLTGLVLKGILLIAFGVLVIGLVDNILRPILVGKDTGMPDYVVLISTLGGIALVGLSGFVLGPMVAALFIAVWDLFAEASEGRLQG